MRYIAHIDPGRMDIMTLPLPDVIDECEGMEAAQLLRHLIVDRFPGKVLVTASLRARSVVTLRLIADIDPSTPVVFCHMKNIFKESLDYKATIIEELGLSDVRSPADDTGTLAGDAHHCENLWGEDPDDGTRRYSTIPLNDTLKPFDCWISAVYHNPYTYEPRPRMSAEGRLLRVHPLAGWSKDEVRAYLRERGLPFHPKAMQLIRQEAVTSPFVHTDDYHY
jgi:phosphoadenosine phosphosulfate reductase